jgi:hypothetical protein
MQCHVEMTERMIKDWCDVGYEELMQLNPPTVQSPQEIETHLTGRVANLNNVAKLLYTKWIAALK